MDVPEPDQSPFTAVTAHTSKLTRVSIFMRGKSVAQDLQTLQNKNERCLINLLIGQLQYYQAYLDASTPYTTYRWVGSGVLLFIFFLRIVLAQGWYIGTPLQSPFNLKKKKSERGSDALRTM